MKLSIKSLTMSAALLWGVAFLAVAVANFYWPLYGRTFLEVMSSVYPGYNITGSLGSVIVGTLYALLDGAVGGALFAGIYNFFAK